MARYIYVPYCESKGYTFAIVFSNQRACDLYCDSWNCRYGDYLQVKTLKRYLLKNYKL